MNECEHVVGVIAYTEYDMLYVDDVTSDDVMSGRVRRYNLERQFKFCPRCGIEIEINWPEPKPEPKSPTPEQKLAAALGGMKSVKLDLNPPG